MAGWFNKDINPALIQQSNGFGNAGQALSNMGTNLVNDANSIDENNRKQAQLGMMQANATREADTYNTAKKKQQDNDAAYTQLGQSLRTDYSQNPDKYSTMSPAFQSMLNSPTDPRVIGEHVKDIATDQNTNSKLSNALNIANNKNDSYNNYINMKQSLGDSLAQMKQAQIDAMTANNATNASIKQDEANRRTAKDEEQKRQFDAKQQENDLLKGKTELVKTLSTNPRAVLGSDYTPDDLAKAMNDAMSYGKVGTMTKVPGKIWGTNSQYSPYTPAQQNNATPVTNPFDNNNDPLGLRK